MADNPYIGKLNPTVGGGLGGLPRRKDTSNNQTTTTVVPPYFLKQRFVALTNTTTSFAMLSEEIMVKMTDSAVEMTSSYLGTFAANTSLQSVFTTNTLHSNRTLFRIPDTNYVIVTAIPDGITWKTLLLKANDFSLSPASITFTQVQDITSLGVITTSAANRLTYSKKIGGNTWLLGIVQKTAGSASYKACTVTIVSDVLTLNGTSNYGGIIYPSKDYSDIYFYMARSAPTTTLCGAFKVNSDYSITDLPATGSAGGNPASGKLIYLDGNSFAFDNANKYTVNATQTGLDLTTGFSISSGNGNMGAFTSVPVYSNDNHVVVFGAFDGNDCTSIIIPDADTGRLSGAEIYSTGSINTAVNLFGSYKNSCVAYSNTSSFTNASTFYYRGA